MASDNGNFYVGVYENERFSGKYQNISITASERRCPSGSISKASTFCGFTYAPISTTVSSWRNMRRIKGPKLQKRADHIDPLEIGRGLSNWFGPNGDTGSECVPVQAATEARGSCRFNRIAVETQSRQDRHRHYLQFPRSGRSIIEAEEVTLPEVEVSGQPQRETFTHRR